MFLYGTQANVTHCNLLHAEHGYRVTRGPSIVGRNHGLVLSQAEMVGGSVMCGLSGPGLLPFHWWSVQHWSNDIFAISVFSVCQWQFPVAQDHHSSAPLANGGDRWSSAGPWFIMVVMACVECRDLLCVCNIVKKQHLVILLITWDVHLLIAIINFHFCDAFCEIAEKCYKRHCVCGECLHAYAGISGSNVPYRWSGLNKRQGYLVIDRSRPMVIISSVNEFRACNFV